VNVVEFAVILHLEGKPVPYVRMTQRGKYVRPRAKRYLASKAFLAYQMKQGMGSAPPLGRQPLQVDLLFGYVGGADHRRDIDNEVKAILDAGNNIVWEDDRWIDQLTAVRKHADRDEVTVIVRYLEDSDG